MTDDLENSALSIFGSDPEDAPEQGGTFGFTPVPLDGDTATVNASAGSVESAESAEDSDEDPFHGAEDVHENEGQVQGTEPQQEYTRNIQVEAHTGSERVQQQKKSVRINREHSQIVEKPVQAQSIEEDEVANAIKDALGTSMSAIEPEAYQRLERSVNDLLRPMQESAFGVGYLVESIARTIEHASPQDGEGSEKIKDQRMHAASKLHALAKVGGRDALKEAVRSLKILIHDIKAVRDRVRLLEDTNGSAHSALNQSEHRLDELRQLHEQLFSSMHNSLGIHVDEEKSLRLIDRSISDADRVFTAEGLFYTAGESLGVNPGQVVGVHPEITALEAQVQELENKLATIESESAQDAGTASIAVLEEKIHLIQIEADEKNEALRAAHQQIEEQAQQQGLGNTEGSENHSEEDQQTIKTLRKEKEQLQVDLTSAQDADASAASAELVDLQADLDRVRSDFDQERQNLLSAKTSIQQELDEIRSELEQAHKELATLKAVQLQSEKYSKKAKDDNDSDNDQALSNQHDDTETESLRLQLSTARTELEELREQIAENAESAQNVESANAENNDRRERLEIENLELQELLEEVRKQAEALNNELDQLKAEKDSAIDDTAESLSQRDAELKELRSTQESSEQAAQQSIEALQVTVHELEARIGVFQAAQSGGDEQLRDLQQQLNQQQEQQRELEELLTTKESELTENINRVSEHEVMLAERDLEISTHAEALAAQQRVLTENMSQSEANNEQQRVQERSEWQQKITEAEQRASDLVQNIKEQHKDLAEKTKLLADLQIAGDQSESIAQEHLEKIGTLERAVQEALEHAADRAESAELIESSVSEKESEISRLEELHREHVEALDDKESELENLREQIAGLEASLKNSSQELEQRIEEERTIVEEAQAEAVTAAEVAEAAEVAHRAAVADVARLTQKIQDDAQCAREEREQERQDLEAQLSSQQSLSQKNIEEKEEELDHAHDQLATLETQSQELQQQLDDQQSQLSDASDEKVQIENERDTFAEELTQLRAHAAASENDSQEKHRIDEETIAEQIQELETLRQQIEDQNSAAAAEDQAQQENLSELEHARAQLTELQTSHAAELEQRDQIQEETEETQAEERAALESQLTATVESTATAQTLTDDMQAELESLRQQSASDSEKATANENALNQQLQQIEEERSHSSRAYEEQLAELREQQSALQAEGSASASERTELRGSLESTCVAAAEIANVLSDLCEGVPQHTGDRQLGDAEDVLVQAQGDLRAAATGLRETSDVMNDGVIVQNSAVADRFASLATAVKILDNGMCELVRLLASDHERIAECEQEIHKLREHENQVQNELDDQHTQVADIEGQLEILQRDHDDLEVEQQATADALEAAQVLVKSLELNLSENAAAHAGVALELQTLQTSSDEAQHTMQGALTVAGTANEQQEKRLERLQERVDIMLSAWQQSVHDMNEALPREKAARAQVADAMSAGKELKELVHELSGDDIQRDGIAKEMAQATQRLLRNLVERVATQNTSLTTANANEQDLQKNVDALQAAQVTQTAELAQRNDAIHAFEIERTDLKKRFEQIQGEAESHHADMHQLRQELTVRRSELENAVQLNDERAEKLQILDGVEAQLAESTQSLARMELQRNSHAEAGQTLIASINDLSLHAADMYDQLGLMSPGASRRLTRATQSFTKAQQSGVPIEIAEYGGELLKRIMDQMSDMHSDVRETRNLKTELEDQFADMSLTVTAREQRIASLEKSEQSLQDTLTTVESQGALLREEHGDLGQRFDEIEQTYKAAVLHYDECEQELRDDIDAQAASHQELQSQLQNQLNQSVAAYEEEAQARGEIAQQHEDIQDELAAFTAESESTQAALQHTLDEREARLQSFMQEIDQLKSERLEVKGLEARIRALNDKSSDANRDIVRMQKEVDAASRSREEAAALQVHVKDLQGERDTSVRSMRKLERQYAEEKARSSSLKNSRNKQNGDSLRKIEKLNNDIQAERERREALQEELRQCKREVAGMRARTRSESLEARRRTR